MSVFSNPTDVSPAGVERYVRAVLELLGDRDPIEVLERTASALEEAVRDRTQEVLRRPEAPGKWSAAQLLRHLADAELAWAYRLRLVLAQDGAELTGYDQDRWASELDYASVSVDESLELFRLLREDNLRLLKSASAEQLARVGRHAERGEESVEHMIRLYGGHDLVHLRQLDRILGS